MNKRKFLNWQVDLIKLEDTKVLIHGFGFDSLLLALLLRDRGISSTLHKIPDHQTEPGIIIAASGPRMLDRAGRSDVLKNGYILKDYSRYDANGLHYGKLDYSDILAVHDFNAYTIVKEDFMKTLLDEINAPHEGSATIDIMSSKSYELKNLDQPKILAEFDVGDKIIPNEYDVVVVCGGILSEIKEKVWTKKEISMEGPFAKFSTVVNRPETVSPGSSLEMWGNGQIFGLYPLSDEKMVAWGTFPKKNLKERESYRISGSEIVGEFSQFSSFFSAVEPEISSSQVVVSFHHIEAPKSLVKGRIVLMGEAAHGISPVSNGHNNGYTIEQALTLAQVLSKEDLPVDVKLDLYDRSCFRRVKNCKKVIDKETLAGTNKPKMFGSIINKYLQWDYSSPRLSKKQSNLVGKMVKRNRN